MSNVEKKLSEMSKEELIDLVREFEEEYIKNNKIFPFQWTPKRHYKVGCKVMWHDFIFVCIKEHTSSDFGKDRRFWGYE